MESFTRQANKKPLPEPVRAKWSDVVLEEGFVPFPKKFVRCLQQLFPGNESMKEVAAIFAVVDFKRPKSYRNPSLEYLAFVAGLSPEDFGSALTSLEERKYVTVAHKADGIDVDFQGLQKAIEKATGGPE